MTCNGFWLLSLLERFQFFLLGVSYVVSNKIASFSLFEKLSPQNLFRFLIFYFIKHLRFIIQFVGFSLFRQFWHLIQFFFQFLHLDLLHSFHLLFLLLFLHCLNLLFHCLSLAGHDHIIDVQAAHVERSKAIHRFVTLVWTVPLPQILWTHNWTRMYRG